MIRLKTAAEIESMRRGGKILGQILNELKLFTKAGISTKVISEYADSLFEKFQVIPSFKGYNGFPASICVAQNNEVVHGIPGAKLIKEGDIVSIDCGVYLDGLHTDSAITFGVGKIPERSQILIQETARALDLGISQVKPGNRLGDISHAIESHLKKHKITVISDLVGHGIGHDLHEEPQVPNEGKKGTGPALKPGMVLAIEPITCLGNGKITTLTDNWTIVTSDGSLSCQQEHTVLVTTTGFEILTLA
jgi:methionyl aminopeptidase